MTQANLLKRLIISDINFHGFLAWNNNTVGVFDPRKKFYRRNVDRNAIGSGDIIACIHGTYIEIEIKIGNDKQGYMQKAHEEKVVRAGGKYFVVKTMEEYQKLEITK